LGRRSAALEILVDAFLDEAAEGVPNLLEGRLVLLGEGFELGEDPARERLADLRHLRIVLQHLARDVERQVLAVHHAAHEAQIGRQELGVVGDVDAAHIELHAALARRIEEIERPGRGGEQQHRIGQPALGLVMQRHGRLVEPAGDGAIGLRVVLGFELALRPLPERARGVDLAGLALVVHEFDRKQDVVRIGLDDALDLVRLEKTLGVVLEVQDDLGAAPQPFGLLRIRGRDLEALAAGGAPDPRLARAGVPARHLDPVRHHEGRIEADPELADQPGSVLGLGQLADEGARARAGDGSQIVDQLLAIHADAGIADRQRSGLRIRLNADRERGAVGEQFGLGDGLVAQLVAGIGAVGDQLAQEHLGLRIDRVNHQMQELGDLGLKRAGLGNGVGFAFHGTLGCRRGKRGCGNSGQDQYTARSGNGRRLFKSRPRTAGRTAGCPLAPPATSRAA
jgi:hypothetical protein